MYEAYGAYDIHVFLWSDPVRIVSLKKDLKRQFAGSDVEISETKNVNYLHVDRFRSVKKKKRPEASISFTGSSLIVSLDGVEISAAAEGTFPGVATIPGIQARNLALVLPPEDPSTIACDGRRLYIGSLPIPCTWE